MLILKKIVRRTFTLIHWLRIVRNSETTHHGATNAQVFAVHVHRRPHLRWSV